MTSRTWSEHLVAGTVLVFALWTLCCQAVVRLGGNLYTLITVFTCVGFVAGGAAWRLRESKANQSSATVGQEPPPSNPQELAPGRLRILRGSCAVAAVAGTPLIYNTGSTVALWGWIAAWLLVSFLAVFFWEKPARMPTPTKGRWQEAVLWSLALAAVIFTLISHRSDYDDSIYVNFAVAAADQPEQPLLAKDTLHGIEGLPLSLAIYRLQSWELLLGAFSWLTGIPAIYCFHWVAAALAALLLPFAHARLFRLLVPRLWPWAVAASLVVLVATGETHRWYGNFAFVRIWQGKSLLVSILLPLVAAFAMEYMARPTGRRWLLLCAVQIAAVGANVTALWAAPAVALAGLVCAMEPTWKSLRSAALGALASSYILAAGAFAKKGVSAFVVPEEAVFNFGERGDLLLQALVEVLGKGHLLLFSLVTITLAWTLAPPGLGRRFAVGMPLAVWGLLLNPLVAPLVFKQVTGPAYWRLLWSLPLPILMSLVLISPLRLKGRFKRQLNGQHQGRLRGWWGPALCLALLTAYALLVPTYSGFSPQNRVLIYLRPMLKVRWPMYRPAIQLNSSVPPGSYVLAPNNVSMWIPTLHHHVYPLRARHYLNLNRFYLGEEDFENRGAMMRYVAGEGIKGDANLFRQGLSHYSVTGVCFKISEDAPRTRAILRSNQFSKKSSDKRFEIWTYDPIPPIKIDDFESGGFSSWSSIFVGPGGETTPTPGD
jgi:hypothetical protein